MTVWALWCVDGPSIRAPPGRSPRWEPGCRGTEGRPARSPPKGFRSKLHLDNGGNSVTLERFLPARQRHRSAEFALA